MLALVWLLCSPLGERQEDEASSIERARLAARWEYSEDTASAPLGEVDDIRNALVSAGLSAPYATKLAKKVVGGDPDSKAAPAPDAMADRLAMWDAGLGFGTDDNITLGLVRGILRKGYAQRKKKETEAMLQDAGATPAYAAELAGLTEGPDADAKVVRPSRIKASERDRHALRQLVHDSDVGEKMEAGFIQGLVLHKGLAKRLQKKEVESTLTAAGISAPYADKVATAVAGPGPSFEVMQPPTKDKDVRALEQLLGRADFDIPRVEGGIELGALRELLHKRLAKRKKEIEATLTAAGVSAGYASELAQMVAGTTPCSQIVKPPKKDQDLQALRDLALDFDPTAEEIMELGFVRGLVRKGLARRRKEAVETTLTAAGLSVPYVAELAEQVVGLDLLQRKYAKAPSSPPDLRAMRKDFGIDFEKHGDRIEIAAVREAIRKARTKRGEKDPAALEREDILLYKQDLDAAETALIAAGLTAAGARDVAKQVAGPFLDTEAAGDGLSSLDKEALCDLVHDGPVLVGTVRQGLRAGGVVARGPNLPSSSNTSSVGPPLSTFELFDFDTVEVAFSDVGLSPVYGKKVAKQTTDARVRDTEALAKPDLEPDLQILKQLGLDFGEAECVGHMRGFLAAVAEHHGPENKGEVVSLEEMERRLVAAGLSKKVAGLVAAKLHRKATAGSALELSPEDIRELELHAEDILEVEALVRGVAEKVSATAGFVYGGRVAKKGSNAKKGQAPIKIDLVKVAKSPASLAAIWKRVRRALSAVHTLGGKPSDESSTSSSRQHGSKKMPSAKTSTGSSKRKKLSSKTPTSRALSDHSSQSHGNTSSVLSSVSSLISDSGSRGGAASLSSASASTSQPGSVPGRSKIKPKHAPDRQKGGNKATRPSSTVSSRDESSDQSRQSSLRSPPRSSSKRTSSRLHTELQVEAEAALQDVGFSKKQAARLSVKIAGTDLGDTLGSGFLNLTEEEKRIADQGLGGGANIFDLNGLVDELVEQKASFFARTLSPESQESAGKARESGQPVSFFHSRAHKKRKTSHQHHHHSNHRKGRETGKSRKTKQ
ncbi:unnamed protein product [Amoebophrya sp. A120]|nr:unnamed protein product [Amoebophrya sp. A120]|eukprot:GSA120T00003277001.1